jgi:hypothetical protein
MRRIVRVLNLLPMSSVDYGFVWKLQKGLMSKVLLNRTENVAEDYLIIVEHK